MKLFCTIPISYSYWEVFAIFCCFEDISKVIDDPKKKKEWTMRGRVNASGITRKLILQKTDKKWLG